MKGFYVILMLIFPAVLMGQTIIMSDGSSVQCSGKFYDSGGPDNPYSNNEDLVFTICPDIPGEAIQVEFIAFSTEGDAGEDQDILAVYNGNSVNAPLMRAATGNNNPGKFYSTADNGCLTFRFTSTFTTTDDGWEADVTCVTPCQNIEARLVSSSPSQDNEGNIRVCPGDPISLVGTGDFEVDGSGARYEWDLGDGRIVNGSTANFSYDTVGVYQVNLKIYDTNTDIDPEGCSNTNTINQIIQVADAPDFTGTEAADSSICLGNTTTLTGIVSPTFVAGNCTPPVSETTSLPDDPGEEYRTNVSVDCFANDQRLESANQIANVCLDIEHSFAGDLEIFLIAPDGRSVELFDGDAREFAEVFLGNANPADDGVPGEGEVYCFSLSGSVILVDAPKVAVTGSIEKYQPGTYLPSGGFDNLVGSPLNGEWTLVILDAFGQDDGTIFEWSLEFSDDVVPQELSFTPSVISETWDSDASIIATNGNEITVQPNTMGQHCYTYRYLDDYGCEYTEEVCIDVLPEVVSNQPSDFIICDTFQEIDGLAEFDLNSKNDEVLGAQDPNDFDVSYYLTLDEADQGVNPLPSNYENISNPQTIYVRVVYTASQSAECYDITELDLIVNLIPDVSLPEFVRICDNTNGTEEIEDPILDTGLNTMDYSFEWSLDGNVLDSETAPSIVATEDGLYTVLVTDLSNNCSNSASTDVIDSSPPILSARVISEPFANNNIIEATAEGTGDYEYSLNGGDFQLSNRFSNVPPGINTVTARDQNGCGEMSVTVTVLNYPRVFTPNSDGINDTWNVQGIANQPDALISIFDRFGKLLKQIRPSGRGWDGTFNGRPLPSTDYWFSVDFEEPNSGNKRNFTSHFSLRR